MVNTDYSNFLSGLSGNRFHVGGAASGFDSASMIDAIIQSEGRPMERLQEKQEMLTNRQKAFQRLDEKLSDFRNFINDWRLQSNFLKIDATSSDEDAVSVDTRGYAPDLNFQVKVNNLAQNEVFHSQDFLADTDQNTLLSELGVAEGDHTLILKSDGEDDISIAYNSTDTIAELLSKINSEDDFNAYAVNSAEGLKVFISGSDASKNISFQDDDGVLSLLDFNANLDDGQISAEQAEVTLTVNGVDSTVKSDTNKFEDIIPGIDLDVKVEDPAKTVTINTQKDVEATVEHIREFKEKYNEIMDYLYGELKGSYEELDTDGDGINDLTEDPLKGALKNDETLSSIFENYKLMVYSDVDSNTEDTEELKYSFLSSVGVGSSNGLTGGYKNIMKGQIDINEDELKAALNNDFYAVWELFGINEKVTTPDGEEDLKGFAVQLSDYTYELTKYEGTIDTLSGFNGSIKKELTYTNKQIVNWAQKLTKRYNSLWMRFASMEQTISRLNQQSSMLSGFGGNAK